MKNPIQLQNQKNISFRFFNIKISGNHNINEN